MMKQIGIVGVGAIAQAYLKAVEDSGVAKVAAICDIRPTVVQAAAETAGCKGFTSHQEMIEKVKLDAIILCTPPVTHEEIAVFLLERKIPVLCEKPLSIDEASAKRILDAGKRNDTLVAMASKFRYVEDIIKTRSILVSGLLGDVHLVENAFVSPVNMANRWNSDPKVSGGGVFIDNGTHSVDILRYLIGPIDAVNLVTHTFTQGMDVEDNAFLNARTADGISAKVDLSWTFNKESANYISAYGSQGVIHVGWKASRYKQHSSSDWVTFGTGYDKLAAFAGQVRNFCKALDGREASLVTAEDALASVQTVQAAYLSARQGGWIKVGAKAQALHKLGAA